MKGIIGTLVSLVVAFYVGRFLVDMILTRDLLTHTNECHEELQLKDRINAPLSGSEIDVLYQQWGACVERRSNFIDRTFGSKLMETTMNGMKEDRKKRGPYNERADRRTDGSDARA